MGKIATIKRLKEVYGNGKGLVIRVDNDGSFAYTKEAKEKHDASDGEEGFETVFDGNGNGDVAQLWDTLFPDADVDMV